MIRVWTYAGYKGDEKPIKFEANGVQHRVVDILDRWYGQRADFFKVRTQMDKIFILRLDRFDGIWDIEAVVK
jgi:hypothetical protein